MLSDMLVLGEQVGANKFCWVGLYHLLEKINDQPNMLAELGGSAHALSSRVESSGGGVVEDAGGGRDEPHGNTTVVEAISERLADVTSLAEQLDAALCGLQRSDAAPDMKRILDGTASTTPEVGTDVFSSVVVGTGGLIPGDWYSSLKRGGGSGAKQQAGAASSSTASTSNGSVGGGEDGGRTSDDEFVTASECTCTPPSRSSSYHTASEGGGASPWWEVDPSGESGQGALVKTTTEIRTGVLIHEVTETTKVRLSHSDTLGVTSYVITSETVRTGNPEDLTRTVEETLDVGPGGDVRTRASTEVSKDTPRDAEGPGSSSDKAESSSDPEVLEPTQEEEGPADPVLSQMKEVRGVEYDQHSPGGEPRYYYHQHIARHAVKGIL
uniref:Uncharacterized protein n=1 Tax=Timema shepardi TaxID=629360 RepID=A0A7R9AKR1_TIMSH|nr:unnamed protein product [Timema shepardi]